MGPEGESRFDFVRFPRQVLLRPGLKLAEPLPLPPPSPALTPSPSRLKQSALCPQEHLPGESDKVEGMMKSKIKDPRHVPPSSEEPSLPIDALADDLAVALEEGPVVISSPTGSGKSTQVPRWCPGPVLVVEPRRVACRALAARVAHLEGVKLGEEVGYHVRDERRAGDGTRILFVTPGIALRLADQWDRFATLVLDEFHERGLEVDLLLALFLARRRRGELTARLLVMSATLAADALARHLEGRHLRAEGRTFPVTVDYRDDGVLLPEARDLEARVERALGSSPATEGDVLVFLPGKGEIRSCADRFSRRSDLTVLELHGGLPLEEQARLFDPAAQRKVVLATNVAETSLTVPGIGVVIDSGLVRRTRYHRGRGFLTRVPVALDSADQRTGRAGRTAAGRSIRLWSAAAQLEERTPPEVHRESLVPLVLAAAACGERVEDLPFFDPPRSHAVDVAREELDLLGALNGAGKLTERGRRLFGLPMDVTFGRLLVEAEARGTLDDMVDLVACLSSRRPLLRGLPSADDLPRDPLVASCDAVHLLGALRGEPIYRKHLDREARREVLWLRSRLRALFSLEDCPPQAASLDRRALAATVLAADPRTAHVPRRRGKRVAWSNGGTEIELGRESAAGRLEEDAEALVVLSTRALGLGRRETRVLITHALPVPLSWLGEAGLGRDRLGRVDLDEGELVAEIEVVFARRVLSRRREIPRGNLARTGVVQLLEEDRLFPGTRDALREHLRDASLAFDLGRHGESAWLEELRQLFGEAPMESAESWLLHRLESLGVESGADLPLLSPDDLLPPKLPAHLLTVLDRRYPRRLDLPGARYELEYDLPARRVIFHQVTGHRAQVPSPAYLPSLPGFSLHLEHKGSLRKLR